MPDEDGEGKKIYHLVKHRDTKPIIHIQCPAFAECVKGKSNRVGLTSVPDWPHRWQSLPCP